MRRLGVDNARKAAPLERRHVETLRGFAAGGVADDVDEAVERVQAAEQIIVLAIAARKERGEMAESHALETVDPVEAGQRAGVLRADAVDQNLVELADLARAGHREGQHVPEREAEIIDQNLAPGVRMPFRGIERSQEVVELVRARVEIDLERQARDQPVELIGVAGDEVFRIGVRDVSSRRTTAPPGKCRQ